MVWLMKAPPLQISSFYFGLLTATKCDTGTRELGIWAKGQKSPLLSSNTGSSCSGTPQGCRDTNTTRERSLRDCACINSATIYHQYKTEKHNCWEYPGDAKGSDSSQCILLECFLFFFSEAGLAMLARLNSRAQLNLASSRDYRCVPLHPALCILYC